MEKKLTNSERIELISRHCKERDKTIYDRIKAVLAYGEGYSYAEIGRVLLLDDETIHHHIEDYFRKKKITPENGGSNSKFTSEQHEQLIQHLTKKTYLHVKDVFSYAKKTYGHAYSISEMAKPKWLNVNSFRHHKPHGIPARADKQKQE